MTLQSPVAGERFRGGQVVPLAWQASDDEGLREFRIQVSLNDARTWSTVDTVGGDARNYSWRLPALTRTLDAVRVRVVAVDHRFQATAEGDDRLLAFDPGQPLSTDATQSGSGRPVAATRR